MRSQKGFTLIEIVATLILLAAVSTIVATRTGSISEFETIGELAQLKTHIRYAQLRALKTDTDWGIQIETPSTYWLFKGTTATKVNLPDMTIDTVTLSALTATSPPVTVTFDGFGSPGSTAVTIATASGNIEISGNTGFIP